MNLKEAITSDSEYVVKVKDVTLYFTLRNPTNSEDLEFRRRSGMTQFKAGKFESRDQALNAPLWLLDQVKTKVEYSNGSAERFPVADDEYKDIPARTKLTVIMRHLDDIAGEETETLKN